MDWRIVHMLVKFASEQLRMEIWQTAQQTKFS